MRVVGRMSVALLLILVTALALAVAVARHDGYRLYIVHTGSMMPTINPGDVVVDKPAAHLHKGEIITFRHSDATTDVVTHRIAGFHQGLIHTKGDANRSADVWEIRRDQVQGAVARVVPHLGYVLVFLKQRTGIAAVMTGSIALVMLWSMFFPGAPGHPRRRESDHRVRTAVDRLRGRTAPGERPANAVAALRGAQVADA